MRAYLAGPMRGHPNLNFDKFERGASLLRGLGHTVVSPAEIDEVEGYVLVFRDGDEILSVQTTALFSIERALNRDFAAITEGDSIVFMPGWLSSPGCKAEYFCAMATGKDFYTLDPYALKFEQFDPRMYDVTLTVENTAVV